MPFGFEQRDLFSYKNWLIDFNGMSTSKSYFIPRGLGISFIVCSYMENQLISILKKSVNFCAKKKRFEKL